MKQTTEDCGIARVSLEWRDLEYDIASMYTRDDGFERLEFLSHLDPRRSKRMEGHYGEWSRDVWATATDIQIDPSKVNGPGGSQRDMWHFPPELHVAAATPKMCSDDSESDDAGKRSEANGGGGGKQQVNLVRERSRTISVPRPSEPGRAGGQPVSQGRARTKSGIRRA